MTRLEVDGAVHSSVRLWLRLEGLTTPREPRALQNETSRSK